MAFDFTLNGRTVHVEGVPAQTTLLDFIRAQGLTGAKEGCAEGECGACTVLVVKANGSGSAFVPMNSCLMFLPMAAGQEIYTVEALATGGRLAECQQAMVDRGGSQCGYCTPGFVVSLFAEQYRPGRTWLLRCACAQRQPVPLYRLPPDFRCRRDAGRARRRSVQRADAAAGPCDGRGGLRRIPAAH